MKLLIEHQCPQCGAPAVLEETDRLFSCEFCRVKSILTRDDYFRYLLPDRAPQGRKLIYIPYWRLRGTLFSTTAQGLLHRFVDVSHPAVDLRGLPVSLGLRSQALKLRFVTPDAAGRFLSPQLDRKSVAEQFKEQYAVDLPRPLYHQAYVGDTLSMIYAPYYVNGRVYDAVLDEPLPTASVDGDALQAADGDRARWPLEFIPALCPKCGWDLDGQRDALALFCGNCGSMWRTEGTKLRPLRFATLDSDQPDAVYLPFWRIRAEVGGVQLDSFADLVRLANLPRVIQPRWTEMGFRFWIPAFKLMPRAFSRLCTHTTLAQPHADFRTRPPKGRVHAVTLPVEEAVDSLKTTLSTFIKPARKLLPQLPTIQIRPKAFLLAYLPFFEGPHDLIQPDLKLAINRNQLRQSAAL